jgi:hypothetical protein
VKAAMQVLDQETQKDQRKALAAIMHRWYYVVFVFDVVHWGIFYWYHVSGYSFIVMLHMVGCHNSESFDRKKRAKMYC